MAGPPSTPPAGKDGYREGRLAAFGAAGDRRDGGGAKKAVTTAKVAAALEKQAKRKSPLAAVADALRALPPEDVAALDAILAGRRPSTKRRGSA